MTTFHLKTGLCAGVLFLAAFGLAIIQHQNSVEHHLSNAGNTVQQINSKDQVRSESSTEKLELPSYFYSRDEVQYYAAGSEEQLYKQREVLEQYKLERKIQED